MDAAAVLVRTTHDGRRVEVIGRHVCLDGRPEADAIIRGTYRPGWEIG